MVLEYVPYRRRFTTVKVDGLYYPFDRRNFTILKCSNCKKRHCRTCSKGYRSERQVLRAVSKLNRML